MPLYALAWGRPRRLRRHFHRAGDRGGGLFTVPNGTSANYGTVSYTTVRNNLAQLPLQQAQPGRRTHRRSEARGRLTSRRLFRACRPHRRRFKSSSTFVETMLPLLAVAMGFEFYLERIPNGHNVYVHGRKWHAVGHLLPEASLPQLPRNTFAKDFAHQGYQWTTELCQMDSDGDGVPNGIELGDANCTWRFGAAHPPAYLATGHPGVDERKPPFQALQISTNIMQRVVPTGADLMQLRMASRKAIISRPTTNRIMVKSTAWRYFYDMLPELREPKDLPSWTAPKEVKYRTASAIGNKVLYLLYTVVFPTVVLMAAWVRFTGPGGPVLIKPWCVLSMWFGMYAGISLGSHRLFSCVHNALRTHTIHRPLYRYCDLWDVLTLPWALRVQASSVRAHTFLQELYFLLALPQWSRRSSLLGRTASPPP